MTLQLGQSDVESFDYLTDDPSRLIVDFYRKTDPDAKKPQTTEAKLVKPSPLKVGEEKAGSGKSQG